MGMRISDLLDKKATYLDDKVLQGSLIALDGQNGKILFDTNKNKAEYIRKFMSGEVIAIWSDVRICKGIGFGDYFSPVMKCYVSHNSWLKAEPEVDNGNDD